MLAERVTVVPGRGFVVRDARMSDGGRVRGWKFTTAQRAGDFVAGSNPLADSRYCEPGAGLGQGAVLPRRSYLINGDIESLAQVSSNNSSRDFWTAASVARAVSFSGTRLAENAYILVVRGDFGGEYRLADPAEI